MNKLSDYQIQQLTGQSECFIHTHPHIPLNQLSHSELQDSSRVKSVSSVSYALTSADEHISIAQNCTITLPTATKGKEYHITLTAAGVTLTITPTSPDTVLGTTSIIVEEQWTSLHLKASENANWILI